MAAFEGSMVFKAYISQIYYASDFFVLCVPEMGVLAQISKRLDEQEWLLPTDVQAEAIPLILGGGDVLMAAETGSGKTGI